MIPALQNYRPDLRDYQTAGLRDALAFVASISSATPMGKARRRMYAAPTGTGKGTLQLALHRELGGRSWIVTPSLDIVRGYLERFGEVPTSEGAMMRLAAEAQITTPTRLVNRLRSGDMTPPEILIGDEAHHLVMRNAGSGDLLASLAFSTVLGYTATPYRGTPRGTAELLEDWGDVREIITIPDAVAGGWMSVPSASIVPLVDDDEIEMRGGDFATSGTAAAYRGRIPDLAALIPADVPTMVVLPDTETLGILAETLGDAVTITAKTPRAEREEAFSACQSGTPLLVIRCATEGFDAPWLRRLVDARPTISPVLWMQTVGRICRPGEGEYICTNRNLERHAYLFAGAFPRAVMADASAAFPEVSSRTGLRQIGLEPLARFKRISVPLLSGGQLAMFMLYSMDGMVKHEWCVIVPPGAEPLVARRVSTGSDWGRWRRGVLPDEFSGFQTSGATHALSEKMQAWWARSAGSKGLDPEAEVNRRQFAALPVLHNLGLRVR